MTQSFFKSFKKKAKTTLNKMPKLVLALLVIVVIQFFSNARMALTVHQVSQNNSQVIDEMGQVLEAVQLFGGDLNEVRQFLLLPTNDYTVSQFLEEEFEGEEEDSSNEDVVTQIFQVIEKVGEEEYERKLYERNRADLETYFADEAEASQWIDQGLALESDGDTHRFVDEGGQTWITLTLKSNGDFVVETRFQSFSEHTSGDATIENVTEKLEQYLITEMEEMRTWNGVVDAARTDILTILTTNEEIQTLLTEKNLGMNGENERITDEGITYEYTFYDKTGSTLSTLRIDKISGAITMGETLFYVEDYTVEALTTALIEELSALDGRTALERTLQERREMIEGLAEDEGFQATLEKYGFQFSFEPVETETAIEYSILNAESVPIRILYLDKTTAELMIKEPADETGSLLFDYLYRQTSPTVVTSSGFVLPENVSVSDTLIEDDDEINLLIAGKNGMNVDTLIFTNIDIPNQKITLISIPRDLYYQGRKINSVYAYYGMNELVRQLSDITGYSIDQYMLVDMFIFIELIDLIGGIEVTLEEDLIDPTYRVVDNGIESTLYYPAGTYQFNGKEALRIARSRYTSSDYSRAERQQLILSALKRKAQSLSIGDAGDIIQIIETVLDKTETNIGFEDALRYYFRHQNFELDRGHVLSTGNVLESEKVPVNVRTSLRIDTCTTESIEAGECKPQYAMYTSRPRDENWDYIRWYFWQILEED